MCVPAPWEHVYLSCVRQSPTPRSPWFLSKGYATARETSDAAHLVCFACLPSLPAPAVHSNLCLVRASEQGETGVGRFAAEGAQVVIRGCASVSLQVLAELHDLFLHSTYLLDLILFRLVDERH